MEEAKWTRMWLDYHRIYDGDMDFKVSLDGFAEDTAVIASALFEFRKAIGELTGVKVIDVRKDRVIGNLKTLSIKKTDSVPPEGYRVAGSDDGITVEASDERGVLYGIFSIIRQIACGKRAEEVAEDAAQVVAAVVELGRHADMLP